MVHGDALGVFRAPRLRRRGQAFRLAPGRDKRDTGRPFALAQHFRTLERLRVA